jgi:hypothetical protein
VVGIAFKVDRTYFGGQFASGEGVTLVYASQFTCSETEVHIDTLTFGGNMAGGGG